MLLPTLPTHHKTSWYHSACQNGGPAVAYLVCGALLALGYNTALKTNSAFR